MEVFMDEKQIILERINATLQLLPDIEKTIKEDGLVENLATECGLDSNKLNEFRDKLETYYKKLKDDILEVAFVGLEKAGKSSVINAFIGKNILPAFRERTTFITTQVHYSEKGEVEIDFYDEEEFNKNVFRRMLQDVKYPNFGRQTITSIKVEDFRKHFESLKETDPNLYENQKNKLEQDIIDIIEGASEIRKLLKGNVLKVSDEKMDEYQPYITDPHKSRAVKEVKIFSPQLKELKNIIIYDLPGFDSPTFIHSKYTRDKIEKADAVVFVRRAEEPSLKGPEIDIITSTRESDGVELREKIFFFLNKSDSLKNLDDLNDVKSKFYDETIKRLNFSNYERMIFGSALARFLKNENKIDESQEIYKKLNLLGIDDGIETLKDKLIDYNLTERRKILIRRINSIFEDINKRLRDLKEKLEDNLEAEDTDIRFVDEILGLKRESKEKIESGLNQYHEKFKKDAYTERKFTKKLKEITDSVIKNINKEEVEELKKEVESRTSTLEQRPDSFNREIRNKLETTIRQALNNEIQEFVLSELTNIRNEIIEIFMNSFNLDDTVQTDFFREEIVAFLSEVGISFTYESLGLKSLIDRFFGDVLELVMLPLTSQDRWNKFRNSERELFSLLAYHEDFKPEIPPNRMPIVKELLAHIRRDSLEEMVKEIVKEKGIKASIEEINDILELLLCSLTNPFKLLSYAKSIKDLESITHLKNLIINRREESLEAIRSTLTPPKTYEEVLLEIERDLQCLKELLTKAVLHAINIEKMLTVQITDHVHLIKESLEGKTFDKFITRTLKIIGKKFYDEKIQRETIYAQRKELFLKLNDLIQKFYGFGGISYGE